MARDIDAGEVRSRARPVAVAIVRPLVAFTKPRWIDGHEPPASGGAVVAATGHIPVRRDTFDAGKALGAAFAAVRAGSLVVVYPERTITRQPELWPMAGRTGAARIALAKAGDPVELDDLSGVPPTPGLLREATERIMTAITALLGDLRGERAPAGRYEWSAERVRGLGQRRAG